jgi:hypothetical protein
MVATRGTKTRTAAAAEVVAGRAAGEVRLATRCIRRAAAAAHPTSTSPWPCSVAARIFPAAALADLELTAPSSSSVAYPPPRLHLLRHRPRPLRRLRRRRRRPLPQLAPRRRPTRRRCRRLAPLQNQSPAARRRLRRAPRLPRPLRALLSRRLRRRCHRRARRHPRRHAVLLSRPTRQLCRRRARRRFHLLLVCRRLRGQ